MTNDRSLMFSLTASYTAPGLVYSFDFTKGDVEKTEVELLKETKMDLKSSDFISVQVRVLTNMPFFFAVD